MEGDKGGLSIESNKHKEGGSSAFEIWNLQNYLTSTFDLGKKSPLKFHICRDKFSFSILKADWQQSGIIHSFPIFQFDPCFLLDLWGSGRTFDRHKILYFLKRVFVSFHVECLSWLPYVCLESA